MKKKSELLNTQMSADTQDKEKLTSENVTAYERVEDTPFTLLLINGEWCIAIANNIVSTKKSVGKEGLIKYIKTKPWELIINTVYFIENFIKTNNLNND